MERLIETEHSSTSSIQCNLEISSQENVFSTWNIRKLKTERFQLNCSTPNASLPPNWSMKGSKIRTKPNFSLQFLETLNETKSYNTKKTGLDIRFGSLVLKYLIIVPFIIMFPYCAIPPK